MASSFPSVQKINDWEASFNTELGLDPKIPSVFAIWLRHKAGDGTTPEQMAEVVKKLHQSCQNTEQYRMSQEAYRASLAEWEKKKE